MDKYTVEQLKALAYDQMVSLERSQTNLRLINAELSKREEAPKEPKKKKNA